MSSLRRRALAAVLALTCAMLSAAGVTATAAGAATPGAAGAFVTTTPTRLLDTRYGTGSSGAVRAESTIALRVAGVGPVPASGVAAVMLNVTVTQPSRAGDIIVSADNTARPVVSNVNFVAGQTVPNSVVAPVGADGKVDFFNQSTGSTHLIADMSGYFLGGTAHGAGLYTPVTPARVLDTRYGVGGASRVAANGTVVLTVAGRGGVPTGGAAGAVVLNVTVTAPAQPGHVTVWADGASQPTTSNVNFVAGQTVPNLVVAPIGSDGKVDLLNASYGTTQLIADVSGYFRSGTAATPGAYVPVPPARLADTRGSYPFPAPTAGTSVTLPVEGKYAVPVSQVSAAVVDAVVTAPVTAGDAILYPSGQSVPTTSNVNFVPGGTSANLAAVPLSGRGALSIENQSGGSIQVVVDVFGYFLSDTPPSFAAQTLPVPPQATGHEAALDAVSCVDVHDCVAVGSYYAGFGANPLVETLADGTWTASYPSLPAGVTGASLTGVSCPGGISTCFAVGSATDAHFTQTPFVESLVAGTWTPTLLPVSLGSQGTLSAVSCADATDCVAVGSLQGLLGAGLVETLSGGSWSETDVPAPALTLGAPNLAGVSCADASDCVAVGGYSDTLLQQSVAWVSTLSSGAWTSTTLPLANTTLSAVSCPAFGSCVATTTGSTLERLANGSWTAQTLAPLTPQSAVSCSTVSTCESAGTTAYDPAGDERPMLATGPAGSLFAYSPPMPADTAIAYLGGVSCATGGCVAVGLGSPQAVGATTMTPVVVTLAWG